VWGILRDLSWTIEYAVGWDTEGDVLPLSHLQIKLTLRNRSHSRFFVVPTLIPPVAKRLSGYVIGELTAVAMAYISAENKS
jgi:hypothetical protein